MSLYREQDEGLYRYEAAAWIGEAPKQSFYRVHSAIPPVDAFQILTDARAAGMARLAGDSSAASPREGRYWLRVKFNDIVIRLDGVPLGGPVYRGDAADPASLRALYERVEKALLAPLRKARGG